MRFYEILWDSIGMGNKVSCNHQSMQSCGISQALEMGSGRWDSGYFDMELGWVSEGVFDIVNACRFFVSLCGWQMIGVANRSSKKKVALWSFNIGKISRLWMIYHDPAKTPPSGLWMPSNGHGECSWIWRPAFFSNGTAHGFPPTWIPTGSKSIQIVLWNDIRNLLENLLEIW